MRKYRAFISYNHGDERVARKLHRRIEGFRPSKRLNPRPRRLHPVFRDRDELAAATNLPEKVMAALQNSENLVVLCSPRAAASEWVNREIAAFAEMHGPDRIFPVIVEGEFGAFEQRVAAETVHFGVHPVGAEEAEDPAVRRLVRTRPAKVGHPVEQVEIPPGRGHGFHQGAADLVDAVGRPIARQGDKAVTPQVGRRIGQVGPHRGARPEALEDGDDLEGHHIAEG